MKMFIKQSLITCLIVFLFAGCSNKSQVELNIIPKPVKQEVTSGKFTVNENTEIIVNSEQSKDLANQISKFFKTAKKLDLKISEKSDSDNSIKLILDDKFLINKNEAYSLLVEKNGITITAKTLSGLFYGFQSVKQIISIQNNTVPFCKVEDYPRFQWRGMHLDVSRHFFTVDEVKTYIDMIAMHKMNVFHWHLTDGIGWRIEIKKYPKLTEIGAWRVEKDGKIMHLGKTPINKGEELYGGFYTQEDVKEIVKYAKQRFITVVPEIEMPGHSSEVMASYPELACKIGTKKDQPVGYSPNGDVFCAGNEKSFEFLENVIDEVIKLFPSEYIHIGGDEVNKSCWKACKKCQARMKKEKLKDEKELQSYFIKRFEKYIRSKGRKLIGWDEILEGGLAEGATVMSWRGETGGIEAAKSGHSVVMTPGTHCYFDHYQANPVTEPDAWGGFTTLGKVYSYNPIPSELNESEAKFVLGTQANLWTENIKTFEHVQYMTLPRMAALAEVAWTPLKLKNWNSFNKRLQHLFLIYDKLNYKYCKGSMNVNFIVQKDDKSSTVKLKDEIYQSKIHYTLDGSVPTLKSKIYSKPISINKTVTIKACIEINGKMSSEISQKIIAYHKAIDGKINYKINFSSAYTAGGERGLIDGSTGNFEIKKRWQGFDGKDARFTLDLGKEMEVSEVKMGFLQMPNQWIFMPKYFELEFSLDNITFTKTDKVIYKGNFEKKFIKYLSSKIEKQKTRYIKVHVKSLINCPKGHAGEGEICWLFIDEIIVN